MCSPRGTGVAARRGESLTPEQRSLRSRMAAYTRWANEDAYAGTAAARAAGPSSLSYWERKVDPDGSLTDTERRRRAEAAKKAHFLRLAIASAEARRRKVS